MTQAEDSEFICVDCNKRFKNRASLRSHKYTYHPISAPGTTNAGTDEVSKDPLTAKIFDKFEKGRTPVQVIMELQISPDVVKAAYKQYIELADMSDAFVMECYNEGRDYGHRAAKEEAAAEIARLSKMHFSVPCPVCNKPMNFSESDPHWNDSIYPVLIKAFKEWQHTGH